MATGIYSARLAASRVPKHLHSALALYLDQHRPTGEFLHAVLSNDLTKAMRFGDRENREHLFDIVGFLVFHVPTDCWGSREKVEQWLALRQVTA